MGTGNCGRIQYCCPPMAQRFLLSQEWSCGERECIGEYSIVVAHGSEIPAYAGMVLWWTGDLLAYFGGGIAGDNAGDNAGELRAYFRRFPVPPRTIPAKAGIYFKHGRQRRLICRHIAAYFALAVSWHFYFADFHVSCFY